MVFIYFEDWTRFISMLDDKGYAHGDRIIKVFAAPFDPRTRLGKPGLKVIESDDSPLNGLVFDYEGRGSFSGDDIEKRIATFDQYAQRAIRALVRFDNRPDLESAQDGMGMKKDGKWLISSPIESLDGLTPNSRTHQTTASEIHLDIFEVESLKRLAKIVDIRKGSEELLELFAGNAFRKEFQAELAGDGKEKKG